MITTDQYIRASANVAGAQNAVPATPPVREIPEQLNRIDSTLHLLFNTLERLEEQTRVATLPDSPQPPDKPEPGVPMSDLASTLRTIDCRIRGASTRLGSLLARIQL